MRQKDILFLSFLLGLLLAVVAVSLLVAWGFLR